jgi:hypothetical protein
MQDIPGRAVSSPSNESHRVLNPDANGYAPRSNSGEFNSNATEINQVNYEGTRYVGTVLRAVNLGSQTLRKILESILHI